MVDPSAPVGDLGSTETVDPSAPVLLCLTYKIGFPWILWAASLIVYAGSSGLGALSHWLLMSLQCILLGGLVSGP